MSDVHLTIGHIARHAPSSSAIGREAAIIDVGQDILLRHLHEVGVLDSLAFKGGTALRKHFAGASGRFSTDLDFAVRNVGDDAATVTDLLAEAIEGLEIAPFGFGIETRRGRRHLTVASAGLGAVEQLTSKLDVAAPPWLEPELLGWVPMPIHTRYGGSLPEVPVVRIEEIMAEKIARLNRTTTARDVYDLVWIMRRWRGTAQSRLDLDLVRRLAVLKIWADMHGISTSGATWKSPFRAEPFDVERWLRTRRAREFDDEIIGLLAAPPPSLDELGEQLAADYRFLADMEDWELVVGSCHGSDRDLVLARIAELPGGRLPRHSCW